MAAHDKDPGLPPSGAIAEAAAVALGRSRLAAARVEIAWEQTVLRKRLVEYRLSVSGEREVRIIGKVYTKPDRGAAAYSLLRYLADNGMRDGPSAVTEPVAWIPDWRMLLMRKAPGRTLFERLLADPSSTEEASLGGRWLRHLHVIPPPPFLPHAEARAIGGVERFATELAGVLPRHLGRPLADLLDRIREAAPPASRPPSVLLHGDFHPRNVFIDDGEGGVRVTAIDVDHARVGDPAWDVGYLVGQMREMARERLGGLEALAEPAAAACREYADALPPHERASFVRRVSYFEALTLVESLHYRRCILRLPTDGGDAAVLETSGRALDAAA